MGKTKIEWTQESWNPIRGCVRVSPGCQNCYAERIAARFSKPGLAYEGLAEMTPQGPRWTGKISFVEKAITEPLRRRTPTTYFVNSMSDLFYDAVPLDWIVRIFAVMALSSQYERYGGNKGHTFQILTKRAKRMREILTSPDFHLRVAHEMNELAAESPNLHHTKGPWPSEMSDLVKKKEAHVWPIPGVWIGISAENQETADERIPELLKCPAAVRWVSAEPLIGPLNLLGYMMEGEDPGRCSNCKGGHGFTRCPNYGSIAKTRSEYEGGPDVCEDFKRKNFSLHWVVAGGESGPGARMISPEWARNLRDECQKAGVAYFFKQWGEWRLDQVGDELVGSNKERFYLGNGQMMQKVGKGKAGRILDGRVWDEFPKAGVVA